MLQLTNKGAAGTLKNDGMHRDEEVLVLFEEPGRRLVVHSAGVVFDGEARSAHPRKSEERIAGVGLANFLCEARVRPVGEFAFLVEKSQDTEGLVLDEVDAALVVLVPDVGPVDLFLYVLLLFEFFIKG